MQPQFLPKRLVCVPSNQLVQGAYAVATSDLSGVPTSSSRSSSPSAAPTASATASPPSPRAPQPAPASTRTATP